MDPTEAATLRYYIYSPPDRDPRRKYDYFICDALMHPKTIAQFKKLEDAEMFLAVKREQYKKAHGP